MRLLLLAAAGLLLSSCAAQRQLTPQRPPTDAVSQAGATASTAPYEAAPGYLAPPLGFDVSGKTKAQSERKAARVLRKWHRQFQRAAKRTQTAPAAAPRKCKGCTIVYGDATVAGKKATVAAGVGAVASHIEKKAGPAQVASDSSTLNAVAGGGNLAAVQGDNNTTDQKHSQPPEKSWLASVWDNFKPALLIGGAALATTAVVLALVNTPAGPWLVALWKRRKSAANQA